MRIDRHGQAERMALVAQGIAGGGGGQFSNDANITTVNDLEGHGFLATHN